LKRREGFKTELFEGYSCGPLLGLLFVFTPTLAVSLAVYPDIDLELFVMGGGPILSSGCIQERF
jgi:hypothetical protein